MSRAQDNPVGLTYLTQSVRHLSGTQNFTMLPLVLVFVTYLVGGANSAKQLPQNVIDEIQSFKGVADRIRNYQLSGAGKGVPYQRLQQLGDDFGARFVGSDSLEAAIADLKNKMSPEFGAGNVEEEPVEVRRWVRGEESAYMVQPRPVRMDVMSLGHSVGTNGTELEADVIVVKTFDELNGVDATGKIVVYNQEWVGYSDTVPYRTIGGAEAAKNGAVASFVKSVTDYSLYTPHTGIQRYEDGVPKIPHGALTVEDVELMQRLQDAGNQVTMKFTFNCHFLPNRTSRNLLAKKAGNDKPDEIVLFGGHIDTWDVGTGSMDDGGGVIISWQVLTILKALNLEPSRTMRCIFWTSEAAEKDKMSLAMESDSGTFTPRGVGFTGTDSARAVLLEIVKLLEPINATMVGASGNQVDTRPWTDAGVPTANLENANEDYFFYHHTHADTMTMIDSDVLDKCSVVWATVAYIVASLKDPLPRTEIYPDAASSAAHATWRIEQHVFVLLVTYVLKFRV